MMLEKHYSNRQFEINRVVHLLFVVFRIKYLEKKKRIGSCFISIQHRTLFSYQSCVKRRGEEKKMLSLHSFVLWSFVLQLNGIWQGDESKSEEKKFKKNERTLPNRIKNETGTWS